MQVTYRQLRVFGKVLTFSMVTGVLSVALVVGVEEREACRQLADRTDSWYYPDPCSVVYSEGTTRKRREDP